MASEMPPRHRTSKIAWMFLAACLAVAGMRAVRSAASTIHTLSGKSYEGIVTIDPKGYFVVDDGGGGAMVSVKPEDLLDAMLAPSSTTMESGLVLTDGSAIAAVDVTKMETGAGGNVTYARGTGQQKEPTAKVARLMLARVSVADLAKIPTGHTGVLLASGDFYEGTVRGIDQQTVTVDSLLFGLTKFASGRQVTAVILADVKTADSNWIVRLRDGSVILADAIRVDGNHLVVENRTQGAMPVVAAELVEVTAGAARLRPLWKLRPDKIDPSGVDKLLIDSTPMGAGLSLFGHHVEHGMTQAAGCSATWTLAGRYRAFLASAGVPEGLVPGSAVKFIVLVDGRPAYTSPPRTSVDDPVDIVVDLQGAQSMVLRIESDRPMELGAVGAWGDPVLATK